MTALDVEHAQGQLSLRQKQLEEINDHFRKLAPEDLLLKVSESLMYLERR